ncbi:MAG: hypothetical protein MJE77_19295 [Proteobacteria bacterium]|nr:hypothetical protein [Pseudomonadota bacterium]
MLLLNLEANVWLGQGQLIGSVEEPRCIDQVHVVLARELLQQVELLAEDEGDHVEKVWGEVR